MIVALFVLLVVAVAAPPVPIKYRAREAEVKQNLHSIQLALERYAVDNQGSYPAYLIGGSAHWSAQVDLSNKEQPFTDSADCPDFNAVSDPLVRGGYMPAYPRNPFVRNGVDVHQAQLTLPLDLPGGDPLRNGVDTGRLYGTRFGAECGNMGQLLGARYYVPQDGVVPEGQLSASGVQAVIPEGLRCGALVSYQFWDRWADRHGSNPLPGQFAYAAHGPVIALSATARGSRSRQGAPLPREYDSFYLAAIGGPHTAGQDVFDATAIPFYLTFGPVSPQPIIKLRSGNPNGIRDGIVLVLTSGEDAER